MNPNEFMGIWSDKQADLRIGADEDFDCSWGMPMRTFPEDDVVAITNFKRLKWTEVTKVVYWNDKKQDGGLPPADFAPSHFRKEGF